MKTKVIQRKLTTSFWILIVGALLIACSSDSASDQDRSLEDQKINENDTNDESSVGADKEEVIDSDQGNPAQSRTHDMNISLGGDITIDSGRITIEGHTNLLPESKINIRMRASGYQLVGYNSTVRVEEDGTFSADLKVPDVSPDTRLSIMFDPTDQDEEIEAYYGKYGENIEGPFIRLDEEDEEVVQLIRYDYYFIPTEQEDTVIAIEPPQWEVPEDYGSPEVWIKPEITGVGERYIYVSGTSNLLEGSMVTGYIDLDRGAAMGYIDSVQANPDGSFRLSVRYPNNRDFSLGVHMSPGHSRELSYIRETYGETGELLEGDFVQHMHNEVYRIMVKVDVDIDRDEEDDE